MDLKDIASISGKSGLFRVVKPTRTGVILETIDSQKLKVIANANNRVSLLKEISVYITGEESSKPLENVFDKIHNIYGNNLSVDSKSTPEELGSFIEKAIPDYDREKVYMSDIKKIIAWYNTLFEFFPERFVNTLEENHKLQSVEPILENVSLESEVEKSKPKKPSTKKKTE